MKLPEEISFLINLHTKFEKLCNATTVEANFSNEVAALVENEVISKEAVKIIKEIYPPPNPPRTVSESKRYETASDPDPCSRGFSGMRSGGC